MSGVMVADYVAHRVAADTWTFPSKSMLTSAAGRIVAITVCT